MPEMLTSHDVLLKTKPTSDTNRKPEVSVALRQTTTVLATTNKKIGLQRSNQNTHTVAQHGSSTQKNTPGADPNTEVRNGTQTPAYAGKALSNAQPEAKEKAARFGKSMARMEGRGGRGKTDGYISTSESSAVPQTLVTGNQPVKNLYFPSPPLASHPADATQMSANTVRTQGPFAPGHQHAASESSAMDQPPAKRQCVDAGLHLQPVQTGLAKAGSTPPLSSSPQELPAIRATTAKSAAISQQPGHIPSRSSNSLTGNGASLSHGSDVAPAVARASEQSRASSHSTAERDLLGAIGLGAIPPRPGNVLAKVVPSTTTAHNREGGGGEAGCEMQLRVQQRSQSHSGTSFTPVGESTGATSSGNMNAIVSQVADGFDPGVTLGVPYTQAITTAQVTPSVFAVKPSVHSPHVQAGSNAGIGVGVIATGVPLWSLHGESMPVRVPINKGLGHVPLMTSDGSQSGQQQPLVIGSHTPGDDHGNGDAGIRLNQQQSSTEQAGSLNALSSRPGACQQGVIPHYSQTQGAAPECVNALPAATGSLLGGSNGTVNEGAVVSTLQQAEEQHGQECAAEEKNSVWGFQQATHPAYPSPQEVAAVQNGGSPFGAFLYKDAEEAGVAAGGFLHEDEAATMTTADTLAFPATSGTAPVTAPNSASAAAYSRYFEGMRVDGQMESPLALVPSTELKPLDVPWPGGSMALERGNSSMQLWQSGEMMGLDDRKDRKKDRHRKASGGRNPMIRLNPTTADRFFTVQRLLESRRGKRTSGSFVVNWLMDVCRPGIQGVVSDEGGLIVDGGSMMQLEEGEDKGSMGSSSGGEDEDEDGLRGQDDGGGCYEEQALVQSYLFPSQH